MSWQKSDLPACGAVIVSQCHPLANRGALLEILRPFAGPKLQRLATCVLGVFSFVLLIHVVEIEGHHKLNSAVKSAAQHPC